MAAIAGEIFSSDPQVPLGSWTSELQLIRLTSINWILQELVAEPRPSSKQTSQHPMQPFRKIQKVPTAYLRWVHLNDNQSSRRRQSRGMAQLVVMLLMLTVLTTSLAIASRITAGIYSQSLQARLRLARDAAEYGLTISAQELNKPGNRLLLGKLDSDWTDYESSSLYTYTNPRTQTTKTYYNETRNMYNNNVIPQNNMDANNSGKPCYVYTKEDYTRDVNDPNYVPALAGQYATRIYMTTKQAAYMHRSPAQYYTNNHQSFQLLSLKLYSSDHTTEIHQAPPDDISYLVMVMQGTYNGSVSDSTINTDTWEVNTANNDIKLGNDAKYVIQQEFEVVPRCCGSSFGTLTTASGSKKYVGTDPDQNEIKTSSNNNNCPTNTQVVWLLRSVTRTANFEGSA